MRRGPHLEQEDVRLVAHSMAWAARLEGRLKAQAAQVVH